jgi:hypothetical protein
VPNAIGGGFEAAGPARFHMIESYVIGGYLTAAAAYRLHPSLSLGALEPALQLPRQRLGRHADAGDRGGVLIATPRRVQ